MIASLESWIEDRPRIASNWTKRCVAQIIRQPFAWCHNKGLIGSNPFKSVSYPKGERGKAMTEAQFRMILRVVRAVCLARSALFVVDGLSSLRTLRPLKVDPH